MIPLPTTPILLKIIAGLSLALMLSLGANTYQLYHAGKVSGKAENQKEIDTLMVTNTSLTINSKVNSAIATLAKEDNTQLLNELEIIAEKARQVKTEYRTIASKAPLPTTCAPGELRVQKVNEGLGAVK